MVTTAAAIGHQAKQAAGDVALWRGIIAESRGVAGPPLAAGAPRRAIRDRRFKGYASTFHSIGADLTDPNWLDDVPTDRPAVIVADGLIVFLTHVWAVKHLRGLAAIAGGAANPGFNDSREPERWVDGLKLIEEIFLTRAPEVAELPPIVRLTSRLAAPSAAVSRMIGTVVLRYRF